jgi:hypothetical protein
MKTKIKNRTIGKKGLSNFIGRGDMTCTYYFHLNGILIILIVTIRVYDSPCWVFNAMVVNDENNCQRVGSCLRIK